MSNNQVIADLAAARAERESRGNGAREIAYGRPGGINDPSKNYDGCDDAAHMLERIMFRRNYPAVTLEPAAPRHVASRLRAAVGMEPGIAQRPMDTALEVQKRLAEACDSLYNMLTADSIKQSGEAWSEAERFLKRHRPDLYNRIGMEAQADLFTEH